jgi:RHS repeat-associated protein
MNYTGDTISSNLRKYPFRTQYDLAGNVVWTGRMEFNANTRQEEARSYYGGDNKLRAVDARSFASGAASVAFEEYRYDALGRRIAVRARRECQNMQQNGVDRVDCMLNTMRRTIWDGVAELGEIQVPGDDATLERDSLPSGWTHPTGLNMHPFFGQVAYTYAGALDQPLAITRLGYQTLLTGGSAASVPTFTSYPFWGMHGLPKRVLGMGVSSFCTFTAPGNRVSSGCVRYDLQENLWTPYARMTAPKGVWHGSLLEDKQDAGGTLYRRNRYYDPRTGRFTQEDPIGLAGGLNLYGFAGGDPVNYADPFGLKADDCDLKTGKDCSAGYQKLLQEDKPIQDVSSETYAVASLGAGLARGVVVAGANALTNSFRAASTVLGKKAVGDMAKRGWTEAMVRGTVRNPVGVARGLEAATGQATTYFFRAEGSFVVRNDATRVIIQVSDRRSAEAIANFIPMIVP